MESRAQQKVVGYYFVSWNSYNLPYDKIEYGNLTHIITAFAVPESSGVLDLDNSPFDSIIAFAHAKGKKVLLSVGGANSGTVFADATEDTTVGSPGHPAMVVGRRDSLVKNIVSCLEKYDYDGVDIDWESPTNLRQSTQMTEFIHALKSKCDSINPSWLITMAVPPSAAFGGGYFNYASLMNDVDWFDVMCYDFYGTWRHYAGHDSPLYQSPADPANAGSINSAMTYMDSRGVPRNKYLIGVPFYGVQFNASGLYQPLISSAVVDPVLYQDDVNDMSAEWSYHWDDISDVPYLLSPDSTQFITFEDTNSVKLKADFSVSHGLGGIMIWEINYDVVTNGSQPLLEAIANEFRRLTPVQDVPAIPPAFMLYDNYPNPFNPATLVRYRLPEAATVTLVVYDLLGRRVATLESGRQNAGSHEFIFSGAGYASGVYLCRFVAIGLDGREFTAAKKMLLLK